MSSQWRKHCAIAHSSSRCCNRIAKLSLSFVSVTHQCFAKYTNSQWRKHCVIAHSSSRYSECIAKLSLSFVSLKRQCFTKDDYDVTMKKTGAIAHSSSRYHECIAKLSPSCFVSVTRQFPWATCLSPIFALNFTCHSAQVIVSISWRCAPPPGTTRTRRGNSTRPHSCSQYKLACETDEPSTITSFSKLTIKMLVYSMLKYPLKCAPAETAGAHFGGYLNNQWW